MATIDPNRSDSRIYSAFLVKHNLLFFLSARSKQENFFTAKVKGGHFYHTHIIPTTFGSLYYMILLLHQIYALSPCSQ